MKKKHSKVLERVMPWLSLAVCAAALVMNVMMFSSLESASLWLAVPLSNMITSVLALLAAGPLYRLLQLYSDRKMREKAGMQELREENIRLKEELDTMAQSVHSESAVEYTGKLELIEFSKKGYVVKERDLDQMFDATGNDVTDPQKGFVGYLKSAARHLSHVMRKILYIRKYYYKVSIGIDLSKIRYAVSGSEIYLYGVGFTRLHDLSGEMEHDGEDVDYCLILNVSDKKLVVDGSPVYGELKSRFVYEQEKIRKDSLEMEVQKKCDHSTAVLRNSLIKTYPYLHFVDEVSGNMDWKPFNDGLSDVRVRNIAGSLQYVTGIMSEVHDIVPE